MDVDRLMAWLIRASKPGNKCFLVGNYPIVIITSIILIFLGRMNGSDRLFILGSLVGCLLPELVFLFFFSMTLNAMRNEEDMRRLAIWKKALLLSIAVMPVFILLLIQIKLLKQLFGS